MRDKVIIASAFAEEKGQWQSRARLCEVRAERHKHRLCLASLFGRRVVNGVGYVFLVRVCVCVCVCMH